MAWGANEGGELGDGASTGPEMCGTAFPCSKTPVAVKELGEITAISVGGEHSLALLSNREVKAWGINQFGELGDGTSAGPESCTIFGSCSTTPVAVCAEGPEAPCPPGALLSNVK